MQPNHLTIAQDAYNAHLLLGVMEATAPSGETEAEAETRCAVIVEMFRIFDAANAMESWIACHCIGLRFMLAAAMRDAFANEMDPAQLVRMRGSAVALSKNLHLWLKEFHKLHAQNEARLLSAQPTIDKTKPAGGQDPGDVNGVQRPIADRTCRHEVATQLQPPTQAVAATPTPVASTAPAPGAADPPVRSLREALLGTTAPPLASMAAAVAPNRGGTGSHAKSSSSAAGDGLQYKTRVQPIM